MSLTAHERLEVLQAFQETFGDRAGIVYEMMQPASNLVTREDLTSAVAGLATKVEMAELRMEMAELRTELKTEMAGLRTDFTTGIHEATTSQTRVLLFGMIGAVIVSGAMNSMAFLLG